MVDVIDVAREVRICSSRASGIIEAGIGKALSPRELRIIRTYLDYPIEVVARKLKVRPNTISKAMKKKIARELRKKLVGDEKGRTVDSICKCLNTVCLRLQNGTITYT